jgi:hypothetical protein
VSLSKPIARVLAPFIAIVIALGAFAAVSVTNTGTADAAAKVVVKTKAPYKKNQTIKVKMSGFPANAQMAVGVCPTNVAAEGPGDCGSPGKGYSRLTRTDAAGKLVTTLRVPKGNLGATNRPTEKCGNKKKDKCSVHASTIGSNVVTAKSKVLVYK